MNPQNCALLVISYGGPEQREDVIPFIENILVGKNGKNGKNVPRERIEQAAQKYYLFDGISPVNEETRRLIAALLQKSYESGKYKSSSSFAEQSSLGEQINMLPIYWGNLYWHPMLEETITAMVAEGIQNVIVFCTVPFASPQMFCKYTESLKNAVRKTGRDDLDMEVTRLFFNHPLFVEAVADRIVETLAHLIDWENQPPSNERDQILSKLPDRETIGILFTAHSVPFVGDKDRVYRNQLEETAGLVIRTLGPGFSWELAYQSRGGGAKDSWIGPDIMDFATNDKKTVIVCPIGFMLENIELLYDLDHEFATRCDSLGVRYLRTETVGYTSKIVTMIRELIAERISPLSPRRFVGTLGIFSENH